MRVIVCGSRKWHDRGLIADTLNALVAKYDLRFPEPTIIHGKCPRGADRLAGEEAGKAGMVVEEHPADWDAHGKRAGLIRNAHMAALGADLCIAFWDGESTGTAHMIGEARKRGIPVEVVYPTSTRASAEHSLPASDFAGRVSLP